MESHKDPDQCDGIGVLCLAAYIYIYIHRFWFPFFLKHAYIYLLKQHMGEGYRSYILVCSSIYVYNGLIKNMVHVVKLTKIKNEEVKCIGTQCKLPENFLELDIYAIEHLLYNPNITDQEKVYSNNTVPSSINIYAFDNIDLNCIHLQLTGTKLVHDIDKGAATNNNLESNQKPI